jgi:minor extracellular serine protease Vpr
VRSKAWAFALAATTVVLVVAAGGSAATGDGPQAATRFAKIDTALFASDGANGPFVPASLSNRLVNVMVELGAAPVAVQDATAKKHGDTLSKAQKAAIREQLKAQQDSLHGALGTAGTTIVGQVQDAYNGIQVTVPQKNVAQLATIPGVVALHAVRTFKPANVNGVPFVGAPLEWHDGVTGTGVTVGIIDTGIDYTHADFGGPGTVAAWDAAKATSAGPADPSMFGPAAPKVKGGFDFSGDAYDANTPGSVPQPDSNPLDCNSHGTHTAGTVGGFGVLADGTTYHGPYDTDTVADNHWNVGPGVAPGADIKEYRVFGCSGSSNLVDLAINQAVADGVNVISMSLGSDLGGTDDPTSVAAQNAVDDGIAVIASAGNAGNNAYVVGSPSTASGVLSVAAMDASVATYPGAHLAFSGGGSVDAIDANGAPIPSVTAPLKVLRNTDGSISLGCDKAEYAGTAGMVVVTKRGTCARVARAVFGDEAGDVAVVMVNSDSSLPPFEGQITQDPDTGEQHVVTIPFLGVPSTAGATLLAADGQSVTLSPTTVPNTGYKKVASFSSGGPRNPDSAPKPDVIAPGVSVASAGMGTGNGLLVDSGTSMACPMTAGIAALVKQAHPTWTGLQIKAAIMNTADPSLNIGYNSRLAGTGVVQAQKAVNSSVLATTGDELDAIAFGAVAGTGDYAADKTITVTNTGIADATYNLTVSPNNNPLGANIAVSPGSVVVPAAGSVTVHVTLSVSAATFAALPSDDTFVIGPAAVLTVRGVIVATPSGGDATQQALRLPFMLVPRGASNVAAGSPSAWTKAKAGPGGATGSTGQVSVSTLPLSNDGIHAGTADLYSWGITDPADVPGQPMDVRDVGVQSLPGAALGGADSDRSLVFLINTWGKAANQSVNEYDIGIDSNGDGTTDYVVVGVDLGALTTGVFNGEFASFTIDAATGGLIDAFLADAPMNGSTIELPALASEIGLADKAGKGAGSGRAQQFTYAVNAFSLVPGTFVDTTSSATFNPFTPAVSSGDLATLAPGATASIQLTADAGQQKKTPALGWLVASVDDANGAAQADEVAIPADLK